MLSTGLRKLDDLLQGGLDPLTEVSGVNVNEIAVNTLAQFLVAHDGLALYIDTVASFDPLTLADALKRGDNIMLLCWTEQRFIRLVQVDDLLRCLADLPSDYNLVIIETISNIVSLSLTQSQTHGMRG